VVPRPGWLVVLLYAYGLSQSSCPMSLGNPAGEPRSIGYLSPPLSRMSRISRSSGLSLSRGKRWVICRVAVSSGSSGSSASTGRGTRAGGY
jgi:hypothetical protein